MVLLGLNMALLVCNAVWHWTVVAFRKSAGCCLCRLRGHAPVILTYPLIGLLLYVSSRMVCAFLEDNGVPLSPWTSPSKGWVVVAGGEKNASAVLGMLLLVPPTCVAGNEGSGALVVLSPSVGARGGRLGMPGSGERCVGLMGVVSTMAFFSSSPDAQKMASRSKN